MLMCVHLSAQDRHQEGELGVGGAQEGVCASTDSRRVGISAVWLHLPGRLAPRQR